MRMAKSDFVLLASVGHGGMLLLAQVHERTLQSDFLMALLKDILAQRRARGRPLKASGCLAF